MTLRYDFDMFSMIPDSVQNRFSDKFEELGLTNMAAAQKAMFRDPKTVEALQNADAVVRDYFLASGFGMNVYDSGAPAGRYPAQDQAAREQIVEKLTVNLKKFDLKGADFGGFEFVAFLKALEAARPIQMQPAPPQRAKPQARNNKETVVSDGGLFDKKSLSDVSPRPDAISDEDLATLAKARRDSQQAKGRRMIAFAALMGGVALLLYVAVELIG